jgi:uncharacterized protein with HEPN domain
MRENLKDKIRLQHILEAIDNIFEFVKGVTIEEYTSNKMLRFAVVKNLEIVGEVAYLISKELKERHPEIEWATITGMRHVLVHGYYQIKDEIIWTTIQTELQPLKDKINRLLSTINDVKP